MSLLFEHIIQRTVAVGGRRRKITLRFWIDADTVTHPFEYVLEILKAFHTSMSPDPKTFKGTATKIMEFDERLNALEIKDENGDGIVVYKNWP